jgi:hypothetical protein
MVAMRKAVIATTILAIIILMESLAIFDVTDANPTWGKPATPIPPIKDPPKIIITSPSPKTYINPVSLNITIIQPDSWISQNSMLLPNSYVDNSNSSDSVVVGQNKLQSITCIIDGQSIILWQGTWIGSSGVTYYLPRVTQFSATMKLGQGQHNLQVNVLAESDYVTEGIIPFAERQYIISANQSTTFRVEGGFDAPMIYDIKSSYVIWQSSSAQMPSPTIAPPQSLNPVAIPSPIPTYAPSPGASSPPSPLSTPPIVLLPTTNDGAETAKTELFPITIIVAVASVIALVVAAGLLVYFKKAGNH